MTVLRLEELNNPATANDAVLVAEFILGAAKMRMQAKFTAHYNLELGN